VGLLDDFFVGIGVINSAFLLKQQPLVPSSILMNGSSTIVPSQLSVKDVSVAEEEVDSTLMQIKEQGRMLEAQMEDRLLPKEQEKLDDGAGSISGASGKEEKAKEGETSMSASEGEEDDEVEQRALLTNDDNELERVEGVLMEVYKRFFDAFDLAKEKGLVQEQNGQRISRVDYDVTVSSLRLALMICLQHSPLENHSKNTATNISGS
jgi:RNA polymerase II subunit A C-terminal domain phosphatase